jgi:Neutral/alkaline non-lysosomal ceramidase, N-terminal
MIPFLESINKNAIPAIILVVSLFGVTDDVRSAQGEGSLRAGIAKINITPDFPVKMAGYGGRKGMSSGVHDSLYVRAVVFENNGKRLVLVSSDLCGYKTSVYNEVRKSIHDELNIEQDELFLSVTHTHSGPALTLDRSNKDNSNNVQYTESLKRKLVEVIREALNNMEVVHTGTGVGYSPIASNRRRMLPGGKIVLGNNPYGPVDKEVTVMKIEKSDSTLKGILFDFACHSTSLGNKSNVISGDIHGLAAQFIENYTGNGVIAPVFAGASGNLKPYYAKLPGFGTENGWTPETELQAKLLGVEAVYVYRDIENLKLGGRVNSAFATINCPRKKDSKRGTGPVPVNIIAARVGDVGFLGVGVEMFTEIGMLIKAASPYKHTFLISICNGGSGYLAPAETYKESGYEMNNTPFSHEAADMIVKQSLKMLYELL